MYTQRYGHRSYRADEGFTLIELLVVMVIIGILAAIAIPLFLNQRKNAHDVAAKSDLRTVAAQEEGYYANALTYADLATIDAAGFKVTLSPRVTVSVAHLEPLGYCLAAQDAASSTTYFYDSQAGGLQPAGVADCPVVHTGPAGDSMTG